MSPTILSGDEVLIKSCSIDDVRIGEVTLFIDQNSKELTLHRLIELPLQTKGDNSYFFENNLIESFLGKAILIKKNNQFYEIPTSQKIVYLSKKSLHQNKNISFFFKSILRVSLYIFRIVCKSSKQKNISMSLLNHL